eukprot:gene2833-3092_t
MKGQDKGNRSKGLMVFLLLALLRPVLSFTSPARLSPQRWYSHIAKAERELTDYLKKVDVVIEVIDARIPLATTHPLVPTWLSGKPLLVAMARVDQVSKNSLTDWKHYFSRHAVHAERPDAKVYYVDGKVGAGVLTLKKQALKVGEAINEKRIKRGIQPRAVRAAVIGFPNVGKSALINRLLGRRLAKSRNLPGVTRSLQWIRIGGGGGGGLQENHLELLDSPGIIPARQILHDNAVKLAICNDIGEASYDRVVVAAAMVNYLKTLHSERPGRYVSMRRIIERYDLPAFLSLTGEEVVYRVAEKNYRGNVISAADKLLGDFRKNLLGFGSLEAPPLSAFPLRELVEEQEQEEEVVMGEEEEEGMVELSEASLSDLDIGKGNYDGW